MAAAAAVYQTHCAACHGEKGDGQGPAARFLSPKPRDFLSGKYKLVTTVNRIPTDQDLLQVITRGMPGSAMFPFGHLPDAERKALVAHVRQLTRAGIEERFRQAAAKAGEELDAAEMKKDVDRLALPGKAFSLPEPFPTADDASRQRAMVLYKANCTTCHGDTGKGDGAKEQLDDDGTPTRPRDFTRGIFKGGRSREQLFARIVLGMPGTPMPSSPSLSAEQVGDLVNLVESFSDPAAQAKVEHRRGMVTARRVEAVAQGEADPGWKSVPETAVVVSPLWWREYAEPDLRVQAMHDGKTLALRLSWRDDTVNDHAYHVDEFEDMAAVQLYKGKQEPFLGMGSLASGAGAAAKDSPVDLWLWRATWTHPLIAKDSQLDEYPFDSPFYRRFEGSKGTPDFLTARAAGNPNVNADRSLQASHLAAQGFGSTTFLPRSSQVVTASSGRSGNRWVVVLRRPLAAAPGEGLSLAVGETVSLAIALWDGQAQDRNGQKLVSIWQDFRLE